MSEKKRLAGRRNNLERRGLLNAAIRRFFEARGFLEIEAPILVKSPGLELHLDAFEVGGSYLITSPEYQMKRLLAAGFEKIYSLGKVFRRGEAGRNHNPEFTMLEWYRAHAGWEAIATDIEELIVYCSNEVVGSTQIGALNLAAPWERVTVRELFVRHVGFELDGDESVSALRDKIVGAGHGMGMGAGTGTVGLARGARPPSWDDLFFQVWLDLIEPRLSGPRPVLVYDWPAPLGALARRKPTDPRVVERFEVYAATRNGVIELCNAFGELTDPIEQRARLDADLAERTRRGLPRYPIDEHFLRALSDMPPAGGIALGVDRLAMLLLGSTEIREVLPFSIDEL